MLVREAAMYHITQPAQIDTLFALGEYLRDVRGALHLSVEEVSAQLHIRSVYLYALESGDWSVLPGLAYGRGYLRQYATHLGMNVDEVMEILSRIQGKVDTRLHYFEAAGSERAPSRSSIWLSFCCIFLLIAGWHFMQDNGEGELAEDYAIPQEFMDSSLEEDRVIPSPYPLAAQECLKLMQPVEDPCYWRRELVTLPVLARKMSGLLDNWMIR